MINLESRGNKYFRNIQEAQSEHS